MRALAVWADKVHDREGLKQAIYAICFKPDGTQLIAGAGHRVLVRTQTNSSMKKKKKKGKRVMMRDAA